MIHPETSTGESVGLNNSTQPPGPSPFGFTSFRRSGDATTVTTFVADFSPTVTVISLVPAESAIIVPVNGLMPATVGTDDENVGNTWIVSPNWSIATALEVLACPISIVFDASVSSTLETKGAAVEPEESHPATTVAENSSAARVSRDLGMEWLAEFGKALFFKTLRIVA